MKSCRGALGMAMCGRWTLPGLLVLVLAGAAMPPRAVGQGVVPAVIPDGRSVPVAAELSPGHWAMDAVRRVEALGLLSRPLAFRGSMSIGEVGRVLEEATAEAADGTPAVASLVAGWRDRFFREFGGLLASADADARLLGLRGRVEAGDSHDRAAPGSGEYGESRTGGVPIEDERWAGGEIEINAVLGNHLGLMAQPAITTRGTRLRRFEAVAGWGNWRVSAGRQPVSLRKSPSAGLILSGAVTLDRVAVATERPAPLPGWLGLLGPVAGEFFVSRLWDDDRHVREPFLWGGTLSAQPFPRLGIAVHRAAMFGGRGHDYPVTFKSVVDMLIGRVSNLGFENQIASVEAHWRLPTEGWVPLTAYMEWGTEDAAGAWWDVPGRVFGLETPAIPGAEALAVGAAYTALADPCCFNPPWYRHSAFPGNWAAGDLPLGLPLGGEGWEWRGYGTFDRPERQYRVKAELFHRDRTGQNLYSPERARSDGVVVQASWRERPGLEVTAEGMLESGRGWNERALHVGVDLFF